MGRKYTRETRRIEALLREHFPGYCPDHPPEAYRYNSASIRVRLVDKAFEGKSLVEREKMVIPVLESLPENTLADITILLLLTPAEMSNSLMSLEFDQPTPSPIR